MPRVNSIRLTILTSVVTLSSAHGAGFPTLGEVVTRARSHGPVVVQASADPEIAGAQRKFAGLPPLDNPYFELTADAAPRDGSTMFNGQVFFPVEVFGQRSARITEAEKLISLKDAELDVAEASAVGEGVGAFGEVLVAAERVRLATVAAELARDDLRYAERRMKSADATMLEVANARGEEARWTQTLAEAQVGLELARARLSTALGMTLTANPPEDAAAASLPPVRKPSEQETPLPAVAAAEVAVRYHAASRERWEAERLAPVNVVVTGARDDLGRERIGGGLAWTLPLFRRNQAQVASASAEMRRAQRAGELLRASLSARTHGLKASMKAFRSAITNAETVALPAAESVVDASLRAWQAGKMDFSRVLLARRDLMSARARRLELLSSAWQTYAELASLTGELP